MKLIIFTCGDREEKIVEWWKDKFFEGINDAETKIITEEKYNKLKSLGIDLDKIYKNQENLEELLERLDEEKKEAIEEILNDLQWLPQAYPTCHCENIVNKKDIEELEDVIYFLTYDGFLATKEDILGWDYSWYYAWWDGSNWRCCNVNEYYEIEVEEAKGEEIEKYDEKCFQETQEYMKSFHFNYYKTKDNNLFRVFISYYKGELAEVDEDFGNWKEIYESLTRGV
jgi:hypothetical protein